MERCLPFVQHCAFHFIAYRGSLERIVEFVLYDMREHNPPTADQLSNYLRRQSTQDELERHWSVALYRSIDGTWRLISLVVPDDVDVCRRRLEHYPTSTTQCRWCEQDERRFAQDELQYEEDLNGKPVHRSLLHKRCRLSWLRLRATAEKTNA